MNYNSFRKKTRLGDEMYNEKSRCNIVVKIDFVRDYVYGCRFEMLIYSMAQRHERTHELKYMHLLSSDIWYFICTKRIKY